MDIRRHTGLVTDKLRVRMLAKDTEWLKVVPLMSGQPGGVAPAYLRYYRQIGFVVGETPQHWLVAYYGWLNMRVLAVALATP